MQRKNEKEQQYTLWPQFDAYVKKVVATANCGFGRTLKKHCKEFASDEIIYLADQRQSQNDEYPSDSNYIFANGKSYVINNDILYDAMRRLPERYKQVLILKFWNERSERDIAKELNVSIRSCYSRRQKAISLLRQMIENLNNEKSS